MANQGALPRRTQNEKREFFDTSQAANDNQRPGPRLVVDNDSDESYYYPRDDSAGTSAYRGIRPKDPEKAKEYDEQLESSDKFSEYQDEIDQNQRRSKRNRRARALNQVISRGRAPKLKAGQKMTTKMFARGKILIAAGQVVVICGYIWLVQLVGFAMQLAGLGIEKEAANFYLDAFVPGLSLFAAGWLLSAVAGVIAMIVCAVIFTLKRIPIFNSASRIGFFIIFIGLSIFIVNPLPMALFWVAALVYTVGDEA